MASWTSAIVLARSSSIPVASRRFFWPGVPTAPGSLQTCPRRSTQSARKRVRRVRRARAHSPTRCGERVNGEGAIAPRAGRPLHGHHSTLAGDSAATPVSLPLVDHDLAMLMIEQAEILADAYIEVAATGIGGLEPAERPAAIDAAVREGARTAADLLRHRLGSALEGIDPELREDAHAIFDEAIRLGAGVLGATISPGLAKAVRAHSRPAKSSRDQTSLADTLRAQRGLRKAPDPVSEPPSPADGSS
jgi:hypothetical protein